MKGKIFDKIITIILVLICVVLAVAIYTKSGNGNDDKKNMMNAPAAAEASETVNVNAIEAETATFIKTRKLSGAISSLDKDVSVYSDIAGKVSQILVKRGDEVKKGDVLLYVNPSKPGMSYKDSAVVATADGTVYDVKVSEGDNVALTTALLVIRGERTLKIDINIPEKDLATIKMGAEATVTSIAYEGKSWNAEITYLSDNLSSSSRTLPAELSIVGDTEGLREGMYVNADVVVKELEDVIMIPTSAISSYAGSSIVYVVKDGKAVRTIIEKGDSSSTMTVITAGLEVGDTIITAGNVTDGTAVAIV